MRMGQGIRTGLGHGGITCVLQTQFSSFCHQCNFRPIHNGRTLLVVNYMYFIITL